jgi:hypothetical protein
MSSIDETVTHPVPIVSSFELQKLSGKEPMAAAGSESENFAQQPLENAIGDSNPDIVLVDFEENNPKNPLNWTPMHKWLIVFIISWMGFIR